MGRQAQLGGDVVEQRKAIGELATDRDADLIDDAAGLNRIAFGADVDKGDVAVFRQAGGDWVLHYGVGDFVFLSGATKDALGRVNLTASGEFLTASGLDAVVSQMAAYASANGITLNTVEDVRANGDLMHIVAGAWQSA